VTVRRRKKIPTPETGKTWFVAAFPSLYFSVFCQITVLWARTHGILCIVSIGRMANE
jgi:hypothetical protein